MASHRHAFLKREEVIGGHWKLHRLFRNPKVKKVLVSCYICFPKSTTLNYKKRGQFFSFEGVDMQSDCHEKGVEE